MLLVHNKIAGKLLGLTGSGIEFLALLKLGNDAVDFVILVGRLLAGAGDDQRRAGFVDQNGVHLVHDGVVVPTLHAILQVELHVVAQVIEAEFVVSAVGYVGGVGFAALLVVEIVDDYADAQAQKTVELAHPFGVALGQVVVDCDHVYAAPA